MTTTIPSTWQPKDETAFRNWMAKIQSNFYASDNEMEKAIDKLLTYK